MDRNPFLSEDPNKMLADGVQTSGEAESAISALVKMKNPNIRMGVTALTLENMSTASSK